MRSESAPAPHLVSAVREATTCVNFLDVSISFDLAQSFPTHTSSIFPTASPPIDSAAIAPLCWASGKADPELQKERLCSTLAQFAKETKRKVLSKTLPRVNSKSPESDLPKNWQEYAAMYSSVS